MSDDQLSRQPDFPQVHRKLRQSLSTCRSMIANYRTMLGGMANDNQPVQFGDDFAEQANEADNA